MFSLQDYLNEHDEALWGLATNGVYLRLLRDNASLTRPAHIEADLSQIFANEDAASFAALWLLIHRSRFGEAEPPPPTAPLNVAGNWRARRRGCTGPAGRPGRGRPPRSWLELPRRKPKASPHGFSQARYR